MACGYCSSCGNELSPVAVFCPRCGAQVEGRIECEDYTYEAFVSYRHRDLDRSVAKRLQRYLEGFKVPKHLDVPSAGKRLGKLFRDEDELPTSSSLSAQIEDALQHARYLVVICSPQSLGSLWVQREVEMFASLHGRKRILLALAEGEPEESFPPLLLHRIEVAPDGTQSLVDEEPLAADFRDESGKKFKAEAARIAAAIIGCGYDDLQQRLRVRKMQAIAAVAAVVAAVSVAFGAFSFYQRNQIEQEHRKAQIHESELLAVEAEELLAAGDRYQAIQVALSALPESTENHDRPFVPAAQLALDRAIGAYPSVGMWTSDYSIALTSDAPFAATRHGLIATITGDQDIEVYAITFGEKMYTVSREDLLGDDAAANAPCVGVGYSEWGLVCCYGNGVYTLDPANGEVLWHAEGESAIANFVTGEDVVTVIYYNGEADDDAGRMTVTMYDASDGTELQSFDVEGARGVNLESNDVGDEVVVSVNDSSTAYVFDAKGRADSVSMEGAVLQDACFGEDALYLFSADAGGYGAVSIEAFDASLERKWVYRDNAPFSYDVNALPDASNECVFEVPSNGTVMASFSTTVVELDAESGSQTNRTAFGKPVLEFQYFDPMVIGVLSDGQVFTQTTLFSEAGIYSEDVTTEDLTEALYLPCDGIGVYVLGRSIAPEKLAVFQVGDGYVAELTRQEADMVPEDSTVYWAYERPCSVDADGISFLDASSFAPRATIGVGELSLLEWDDAEAGPFVTFVDDGQAIVWGEAASGEADVALYRVSDGGEVLQGAVVEDAIAAATSDSGWELQRDCLAVVDDGRLLYRADDRALLIDAKTLDVIREFPALQADGFVDDARYGAGNVLVLEHDRSGGAQGRLSLYDGETGQQIACDLDEYSYYVSKDYYSNVRTGMYRALVFAGYTTAVSPDGQRVAVACSDGATRAFDLADGHLVWESWETPPQPVFLGFVPGTDKMVAQDEQGRMSLVSAEDGSLVTSTLSTLPPIDDILWASGSSFLVNYHQSGAANDVGLAVVSVLEEGFGPYMDMPGGVALNEHFDQLLVEDGGSYYLYPTLVLDESVTVAKGLVEDHPLTESEAAYYQVDQ